MKLLNSAHAAAAGGAGTGVRFVLHNITTHVTDLAAGCSPTTAPAIGSNFSYEPSQYLNLYSCSPVGGILGWCAAPGRGATIMMRPDSRRRRAG